MERAFKELLRREPLLVVPGVDDIFGWERRLTEDSGAMVGGQVVHFRDLCAEIINDSDAPRLESAGDLQRLELVAQAVRESNRRLATRLAEQPGIAEAVMELIDDFRAELINPATLEARLADHDLRRLRWLSDAYGTYMRLLAERNLTDGPNEITRALGKISPKWAEHPFFVAGFDDMTGQQLELIRRLAVDLGAEVTVAISHEADNPGLEMSNRLMSELLELKEATALNQTITTRGEVEVPHQDVLLKVEERFLRQGSASREPLGATERLTVMRSSGSRSEAEAIGGEIAKLVADGVPPEEIAIAVTAPAQNGPVIRDTLSRFGIPVALESETKARETSVGGAVLSLLKAVMPGAGPREAIEWLRSPLGPEPAIADRAELRSVTAPDASATEVFDRLAGPDGATPPGWNELRAAISSGKPVNEIVAGLASDLGLAMLAADTANGPSAATVIETQAATAIAGAARELQVIQDSGSNGLDEIRAAIESGAVKLWSVPAAGTVRIASPYSLRAKRFSYLFMASQQEGGIHDTDRAGPFLSATDRSELGMRDRTDPEVQARYLFYSCLTVPTDGLWISCRTSDEEGKAEQPSPLIGAVEELFEKGADGLPAVRRAGRTGSDILFEPGVAPNLRELARALAADAGETPAEAGDHGTSLQPVLRLARQRERETRRLASLTVEAVLEEIARDPLLSATEIEAYAGCPYRWFIERRLRPVRFGPDPDYFSLGTLLHGVLENVYGRFPGEVPRPGTLENWLTALPEIVEAQAATRQVRLDGNDAVATGQRARALALVSTHLTREASRPAPGHLPAKLEYSFGTRRSEAPAVDAGGWKLCGKVDRIDLSPDCGDGAPREAVVIDFKSGDVSGLTHLKSETDRRLQLQLYLHAARVAGYTPVAGLYVSLSAKGGAARGAFSESVQSEMLARGASDKDVVPDIEGASGIDSFIQEGLSRADESVRRMLTGLLDHDPASCPDHFVHPAVPDRTEEPGPGGTAEEDS
jgi:ATP-dependent helicase/DNAse subunit B